MEAAGTIIIGGIIDGENGDMPMQAFQWNTSATVAPAKPTRGAYDAGWTPTAPNRPTGTADYFLWMTQTVRHKATDGTITYDDWSTPVRISGDKGTPGEDSSDTEWIYRLTTGSAPALPTSTAQDKKTDGYVPQGWTNHPTGVDSTNVSEYACYRTKPAGSGEREWSEWKGKTGGQSGDAPILWSHYGRNGIDGDGTEYVFIRTKKNVSPVMDSTQSGYNADEFRPSITSASQTASQTEQAQTTDDPKGPDSSYPYEWVATRSKVPASQAAADGSRSWSKYTGKDGDYKMSLWAKWASDGKNGDTILASCSLGSITVACDSSGQVVAALTQSLTFTLSRNGSQTPAPTVTVKDKPSGVTIRTSADTSAIPAGAASLAINAGESMDNLATGVVFLVSYQGYSAECNVAIVCTKAGDDAVVYSLQCSPAAVNFRSNAVGEFSGSYTLGCKVMKTVGNNTTEVAASGGTYDGMYLKCRKLNTSGNYTSWDAASSVTLTPSDALTNHYVAVEFALSADSGMTAVKARVSVPIMCDGHRGAQGEQGAMGKMFYPMGEWNAQTTYSRTGDLVPLVFLPDPGNYNETIGAEGHYFYLYDDTNTGTRPVVNDSSNPWRLCDTFGVVITQGLFAEFAKMGKGIFSGDYFFSMNGRIGTTEYQAGATISGVPAYTRFCGDPSSLAGKVSEESLSGPVSGDVYTIASVRLQPGVTFRATIVGRRTSSSGTYYFRLRDPNGTIRDSATISSATETTKTLSYTVTTSTAGTFTLVCYGSSSSVAVSFAADYGATGYFEPNWWVDLLTGKMSAARGNFVVDSNGDVHVKSGDVDVSGTIRATNLFRSTALCWGGGECCLLEPGGTTVTYLYVKSLDRTESPSLAAKYGFAIGDYFPYTDALKNSDDAGAFEDGMNNANYADNDFIPCTYSADAIELLDKPTAQWPSGARVYLPLPSAFAGKMVEVRHNMTSGTSTASVRVVNLGTLITLYPELDEHGKLKVGGNSLSDQCTVNAGQIASFYSTGTYWVACGVVR